MNHEEYRLLVAKANEQYQDAIAPINNQLREIKGELDIKLTELARRVSKADIANLSLHVGDYVKFNDKNWQILKFGTYFYNNWNNEELNLRGMPYAYAVIGLRTKALQKPKRGLKIESVNIKKLNKIEVKNEQH